MKTSKADFERFKMEFLHWQKRLSLMDWRVRFRHDQLEHGVAAQICPDSSAKLVSVYLGFICDHPVEEAARHEALELLMSDLEDVARSRYIRPDDVVEKRHAVIRRLENLLDGMKVT